MPNVAKMFGILAIQLIVAALFARTAAAASTNWYVRPWQASEGVTSNIPGIVQTQDGYLWVATDRGLVRFDGVRFEDIPLSFLRGSNRPKISVMSSTHAGGLVMAINRGGIVRMNPGKPPEVYTSPELTSAGPVSILEDESGSIWVSYHLSPVFRVQNGKIIPVTAAEGLPSDKMDCLFVQDLKNKTWFMQGSYVGQVNDGHLSTIFRLNSPGGRLAAASGGGVWICSGPHLYHCSDDGKLEDRGTFTATGAIEPTALVEDRTGTVWIGTAYTGLFCYDGSSFENVSTSHEHVSCLIEDHEGNVWVGTRGGGLDCVQPRAIMLEGAETGLPSDSIQSICEDSSGIMWAVAQDGSLRRRTKDEWELMSSTDKNWPGGTAICVVPDQSGGLWIGTRNTRLYYLKNGQYTTWDKAKGMGNHVLNAFLVTRTGDLWIAEQNLDGLHRLRNGKLQAFNLPPKIDHIRAMTEDAAGTVWIGTDGGTLLRVDGDTLVDETSRVKPGVEAIRCFYAAPDGALWMGAGRAGLARLKNGALSIIDSDQGLYDNIVSQMTADSRGWLWCGGPRGIFRLRLQQLNDVADGHAAHVQSVHYGGDEGLPRLEATFGACANAIHTNDGRIWMLMGTALAIISPEKVREQMQPPPVYLERVSLDDHVIASYQGIGEVNQGVDLRAASPKLSLPADYRKLQFDFTALSFDAPDNVRFQFQLEGLDETWQEAGTQRSAAYSRLDPNDYRFHVRACNSDGVWNELGATLNFSVVPFFWQTWWFRVAGITIFTILVVLLARYAFFRRLRTRLLVLEQQTALQRERARIARDLHDDLGARLTEIVMLSDITVHENGHSKPNERVCQISTAARQVIKSLDETVWAVNPRNDTLTHLVDYIGQFAVEFLRSANIRCRVDLLDNSPDRPVSAEVRHNVLLVVKEALNNVVRHAHATETSLRVKLTPDWICLTIQDNGKGFASSVISNGGADADGLLNMRHRMEEIGGSFEIKSDPGTGTCVSFIFPWSSQVKRIEKE